MIDVLKKWKTILTAHLPKLVLALLVLQPFLDVFSYAMTERGTTIISTLLRFFMLGLAGLLGFVITDKKKIYLILYGIMAGFWVLHVLNGFRVGYISLYEDTANYLRVLTLPVFLLSFLTFFQKKGEELRRLMAVGFAVNMGLSALFTALPWALVCLGLGKPIYTYDKLYVGFMGWFAIPNAQSCILVLVTPLTLFFAYRTKKLPVFLAANLLCFFMLFITGTKLTYYSIFLIPVAYLVLLLLNPGRRKAIPYMAVLLGILVLMVAFRHYSPMQIRESMSSYSQGMLGSEVEKSLAEADEEVMEAIQEGKVEEELGEAEEESTPEEARKEAAETLFKVRRSLNGIYTDPELYGKILEDLNDRFGVYNVMASYHHTAYTWQLSDLRLRRTNYAELVWSECDFLTRLLGFEYSQMIHNGVIYDMENDFPSIYYNCGWLGLVLYLLLFLCIAFVAVRGFLRNPLRFLTIEVGAVGMTVVLALAAAQISGYVFRRPNVAIYLAVAAAYLCYLSNQTPPPSPEEDVWRRLWQYGLVLKKKFSKTTNAAVAEKSGKHR